jgi:hypothetical protein
VHPIHRDETAMDGAPERCTERWGGSGENRQRQKQIPPLRYGMTKKLVYINSGTALTAQDNSTTTNCFHCALSRNIRC